MTDTLHQKQDIFGSPPSPRLSLELVFVTSSTTDCDTTIYLALHFTVSLTRVLQAL